MVEINWTILWQVINFLILLGLLIKYLYNPIIDILDQREQEIKDDLDQASERKQEAEKLKQEYQQKLKEARDQAQEIIEEAERRGKKKANQIVEKAEEEAEIIKQNKLKEVERAKREAADELKDEVTSISLQAAGKIIQKNLDKNKHKEIINQYIENLDAEKLGEIK